VSAPAYLATPLGDIGLWGINDDRDERAGNVDVTDLLSFGSEEAFLSGLTEEHSGSLSGKATGFRLSNESRYSSDPVTAIAEWVQEMMALLDGGQGDGYELSHAVRDYSKTVAIEDFSWSRDAGAKFEVGWNASFKIGDVTMASGAGTSVGEADPSSSWSLDGIPLQNMEQIQEQKQVKLNTTKMMFADSAEENSITQESGATRRINITGSHTGTRSERNSFDSAMRALIGKDKIVDYESPFPGHTLSVAVDNYDSDLEGGSETKTDYTLNLVEGTS